MKASSKPCERANSRQSAGSRPVTSMCSQKSSMNCKLSAYAFAEPQLSSSSRHAWRSGGRATRLATKQGKAFEMPLANRASSVGGLSGARRSSI